MDSPVAIKYLCLAITVAIAAITYCQVEKVKHQAMQISEARALMLTMMRGGLSALESRCILEVPQPELIKDCIRQGTPTKGREL